MNNILLDEYEDRKQYIPWLKQTFVENDLFISLNCPRINHMSKYINSTINSIEYSVFLRRPVSLFKFVMLVNEPQRHIHMLIQNVEKYSSDKHQNFRELVYSKFSKRLDRLCDVDVKYIDKNIDIVVEYILIRQDKCCIDTPSLNLRKI